IVLKNVALVNADGSVRCFIEVVATDYPGQRLVAVPYSHLQRLLLGLFILAVTQRVISACLDIGVSVRGQHGQRSKSKIPVELAAHVEESGILERVWSLIIDERSKG